MPPKRADEKKWNKTCGGKRIGPTFQAFANDPTMPRNFLGVMMEKFGYLDRFKLQPNFNECEFSFDDSPWYAVHVKDQAGNSMFYDRSGNPRPGICYFKIIDVPDAGRGQDKFEIDPDSITFEKPAELAGKTSCVVSGDKCIKNPAEKTTPTKSPASKGAKAGAGAAAAAAASGLLKLTPAQARAMAAAESSDEEEEILFRPKTAVQPPKRVEPKATPPSTGPQQRPPARAQPVPSDIDPSVLEALTLGESVLPTASEAASQVAAASGPKNMLSRDEAEKMDKLQLIDWMAKNMNPSDILTCLRTGSLSAQDKAVLAAAEADIQQGVEQPPAMSQADLEAMGYAQAMKESDVQKMFAKISKQHFIEEINSRYPPNGKSPEAVTARLGAIIQLCQRTTLRGGQPVGAQFEVKNFPRGGPKIVYAGTFDQVDPNELLNTCSNAAANRARLRLRQALAAIQSRRQAQGPVVPVAPLPQAPAPVAQEDTFKARANALKSITDIEQQADAIIELASELGLSYTKAKGRGKNWTILDETGSPVFGAKDAISRLIDTRDAQIAEASGAGPSLEFGRRRKRAACAPRSCKRVKKSAKRPLKVSMVRKNFKCAVKKCRGSQNYKKCMKTTLRKIYRKSSFGGAKKRKRSACKRVKKSAKRPLKVSIVRKKFKCAAKKCRGSRNYKKCMKTTLRKIYKKRKTSFGKKKAKTTPQKMLFKLAATKCKGKGKGYRACFRKAILKMSPRLKSSKCKPKTRKTPKDSALLFKVGTIKTGCDGKKWRVLKKRRGVNRWVRVTKK